MIAEWLSILDAIADRSHRMGVLSPIASMPSHAYPMDGTSITIVVVSTPVHCLKWTPETPPPTDHALDSRGSMAIGVQIDV